MPPPKVILGTNVWGQRWTSEEEKQLPPILKELGIRQVDTSPIYPHSNPGKAEELLGELQLGSRLGLLIDSKVGGGDGGRITKEEVEKSVGRTLSRTAVSKINILYVHSPDYNTPLEDQAAAIDIQYRQGRIAKLGLCNFPIAVLEDWLAIAEAKGYIKPAVYQGQYNLLHRTCEEKLLGLLRKHSITFIAHSPLAGGVLTGKLTIASSPEILKGTRFETSSGNALGDAFRAVYDKPSMHSAIRKLKKVCEEFSVDMAEAAMRWILYHSSLQGGPLLRDGGDGVIIGPHNLGQLQRYTEAYMHGPLDEDMARQLSGLWEDVKGDAENLAPC